jgi:hypothetical protein
MKSDLIVTAFSVEQKVVFNKCEEDIQYLEDPEYAYLSVIWFV